MPKKPEKIVDPLDAGFDEVAESMVQGATPSITKASLIGKLPIGGVEMDCAVLNDEKNTRVIKTASIFKAFDRVQRSNARLINIPAFMDAKSLQPFVNEELRELIKPVEYFDGNKTQSGYNALILPCLCELYLKARREGALTPKQEPLAVKAEILQSAFAKVGITALIDEATGFQRDRKHDALRILLQEYIADGLRTWAKTFPDSFFVELDRIYGNEITTPSKRPQYYGKFINRYIYDPIENGFVKSELNRLNIREDGTRRARFHQWLTDQGKDVVRSQIFRVQGAMEMCSNIENFRKKMQKQKEVSIAPYLWDEMNEIDEE